jgi:hypothetical protein
MGRKSNVCALNNWGVPTIIMVPMSVNNVPSCLSRKSSFYPQIELNGHRGSVWRVIKCVPQETDFMGRVCNASQSCLRKTPHVKGAGAA